jgi:cell division protein FtsI (penicillin-binding protein 3)/stage V sporulation protein D (sporulation-specific penicillin-binding protein)
LLTGFLVLCGRLYFLQVLQAGSIAEEVETVRKRLVRVDAKRGDILDRNGNLLAGTRSRILLGADPQVVDVANGNDIAMLAGVLDMSYGELMEKLSRRERTDSAGNSRKVRWVPVKEIDEDLYRSVQGLKIRGVYGNRRYERYYPGHELGSHIIGFINKEDTPVMGVENALDYYLSGQAGWRETEVDGHRRELAAYREREVSPRNGLHVELTLDLFVQSVVESAMQQLVEETNPAGASIIVSDPASGEILGLANYPTFDPNSFWDFPIENQRNRALTDQYEPGSTFKIVPVSAALEEGLVGPDTIINCGVERKVFNGVSIRMPTDHRNLGSVPVRTVVAKSSNRGAAQLGMMLGEQRMYDYSRKYGFGETVGWPLSGEIPGSLMPVSKWDGLTISRLPTGYAIGATPMQVHLAMATLANDGVRLRPKLLSRVIDPLDEVHLPLEPERGKRVVSKDTARAMREMLVRVVSREGTARRAELPGYAVAGKTGTSRKIIDGQYSTTNHFGSFSGFFPANDPKVVITVVVDDANVTGPAYGGVVAAPTFRRIGEKLIPHMAIRKPNNWEPFLVSND